MEKYKQLHGFYPKLPVADAGYGSYDNYSLCIENDMELMQKYTIFSKEREKNIEIIHLELKFLGVKIIIITISNE